MKLLEDLTNCSKELDTLEMEKRQKENDVKELEVAIEEIRNSIKSAKETSNQEIEMMKAKLKENQKNLENLQNQLDEALVKVSSQNSEIKTLNEKLSDLHYFKENNLQGKGNLRGFPYRQHS
jgi:chromosome segregation ATPase